MGDKAPSMTCGCPANKHRGDHEKTNKDTAHNTLSTTLYASPLRNTVIAIHNSVKTQHGPGLRRSTLNLNSPHGGQADEFSGLPSPNVPDSCKLTIGGRFLLEESIDEVKGEVVDIL